MTALKICPTCSAEYPANERFCPRDGTALRAQGGAVGDLVGSIIAERYHVIRKLGEGGMGTVYLAEHVKMGRKSAVKVMNAGMSADADAISRFNREASNASRINHPNVAGIYDFGETPDGLIYLAMEYVEGEPLTAVVEANGALPSLRAADITRQAAEALSVAHDMGIVHRDLKPDNIMLAKNRDGSDCVKVVDFGIAKAANSDAQKVTKTGLVVGTPEYMSPEQLSGDKLDGRSDVYSLALVAFNMLTGTLPFPSETAQESMIMRLTDRPKSLADMKPDTAWTPAVQAVMDRALERDAKVRFPSATEFGQALWTAVCEMPASAEGTVGTLVMNATSPAGPAAEVPPTRVSSAGATDAAPMKGTNRVPILVGSGLAAVLLLGGAVYASRRDDGAATPREAAGVPVRAVGDSVSGAASGVSLRTSAPVSGSAKPSGVVLAPAGGASRRSVDGAGTGGAVSYMARLRAIDRRAEDAGTARQALGEAGAMREQVTLTEERVYLAIIRAQAYGTLGDDARSCRELKAIAPSAKQTSYDSKLSVMLANCP
ncbi:MAG TPA: serine/threonine-protein kinase [Gemmatimonadaceae bacterium]|nr:serine/threonine-protein kinase [Gemmatimonadaceae bacterium]